ncbi:MAG: serine/threonine-protein kinase [Myxococcota bacterium]
MNAIQVGSNIEGRYKVTGFIGEGGFASVFQGVDIEIEREVAIKAFNPLVTVRDPIQREMLLERFRMEARTAAKIHHPNVVIIHDIGVTDSLLQPYIVMELLHGHDLEKESKRYGPMSPRRALPLVCECLEALGEGHQLGIVHKDLKPSNLFLTDPHTHRESLRIVDFGIAHLGKKKKSSTRLTGTGQLLGTPQYYAPEYVRRQMVTPALDVYQMGLILVEMLTGQKVVSSEDPYVCLTRHCEGDLDIPARLLDSELGPVLRRALMLDHRKRYPNAHAFCDELTWINPKKLPSFARSDKRRNPHDPFGDNASAGGAYTAAEEAQPDHTVRGGTRELPAPKGLGSALLEKVRNGGKSSTKRRGTISLEPGKDSPELRRELLRKREQALAEFHRPRGGTFNLMVDEDPDRRRASGHTQRRRQRRRRRERDDQRPADLHHDSDFEFDRPRGGTASLEPDDPFLRPNRPGGTAVFEPDDPFLRPNRPGGTAALDVPELESSEPREPSPIDIEALLGPPKNPNAKPKTGVILVPGDAPKDIQDTDATPIPSTTPPPQLSTDEEEDDEEVFEYDYGFGLTASGEGEEDDDTPYEYAYDVGQAETHTATPTSQISLPQSLPPQVEDEDVVIDLGARSRSRSQDGPNTISLDLGERASQTMVLNLGQSVSETPTGSLDLRGGIGPAITGEVVINLPNGPNAASPGPYEQAEEETSSKGPTTIVLDLGLAPELPLPPEAEEEEEHEEASHEQTEDAYQANRQEDVRPVGLASSPDRPETPRKPDAGSPPPHERSSHLRAAVAVVAFMLCAVLVIALAVPDVANGLWGQHSAGAKPSNTAHTASTQDPTVAEANPSKESDGAVVAEAPSSENADGEAPQGDPEDGLGEDDPLLEALTTAALEQEENDTAEEENAPATEATPREEGVVHIKVTTIPGDAEISTTEGKYLGKGSVTLTLIPGVLDKLRLHVAHKDYVRKITTVRPHHAPELRLRLKTAAEVEAEIRRQQAAAKKKRGLIIAQ